MLQPITLIRAVMKNLIKKAKGLGYIYFAKAQNPGSVTAEGSGLYSPAGSNSSQDHANTSASAKSLWFWYA